MFCQVVCATPNVLCGMHTSRTDPITSIKPRNPPIDNLYVVQKRQSTDFETRKLWKFQSDTYHLLLCELVNICVWLLLLLLFLPARTFHNFKPSKSNQEVENFIIYFWNIFFLTLKLQKDRSGACVRACSHRFRMYWVLWVVPFFAFYSHSIKGGKEGSKLLAWASGKERRDRPGMTWSEKISPSQTRLRKSLSLSFFTRTIFLY